MSARLTLATTHRVLRQLHQDRRTVAMMLFVPVLLLSLLAWVYDGSDTFDRIGPPLLGIFPFIVMFLVTSVATLRERTSGTLERLLTMPLGKGDLLVGYALAFGLVAVVQSTLASAVAIWGLDLELAGSAWLVVVVALANGLLGTALGLLVSAFARSEFQAVQFLPAVILPQFLLCGLLVPRGDMPEALQSVSDALPLSYAVDALTEVQTTAGFTGAIGQDLAVILGFTAAALAAGAATLRRRTD
jgi:ABC-2 type transport system permease protein